MIIDNHMRGKAVAEISSFLSLPQSTVRSIVKTFLKTGETFKRKRGGETRRKVTAEVEEFIKNAVNEDATKSLKKISQELNTSLGINLSKSTIDNVLDRFNFTLKRVSFVPERRVIPAAIVQQREYSRNFLALLARMDDSKIFFADECGFNVSMRTKRGRAVRGSTPMVTVPALRSKNFSVCCAMSKTGLLYKEINHCAYNSTSFLGYLTNFFSFLRSNNLENCVIVLDNVAFHKCSSVLQGFLASGNSVLFLPAYCPDLNPIENLFSKWKTYVRASSPRNEDELLSYIEHGFQTITSNDCGGYFRHMLGFINELALNTD